MIINYKDGPCSKAHLSNLRQLSNEFLNCILNNRLFEFDTLPLQSFLVKASFWSKVVQPFCLFAFLFFPWSTQKRLSPFILKPEIEYHCWRAVSGPTSSASYLCTSNIEIKKKELIQQKWGWFTCYQKVW